MRCKHSTTRREICVCPTLPQQPPRSRPTSASPNKRSSIKDNMTLCRVMLRELDHQNDAWPVGEVGEGGEEGKRCIILYVTSLPFLLRYPDIDTFAQDARLVFSNCAFYNEDDSEVCCHGNNECQEIIVKNTFYVSNAMIYSCVCEGVFLHQNNEPLITSGY